MLILLLSIIFLQLIFIPFLYFAKNNIALSFFLTLNTVFFLIPTYVFFYDPSIMSYALEGRVANSIDGNNLILALTYVLLFNIVLIFFISFFLFLPTNRTVTVRQASFRSIPIMQTVWVTIAIHAAAQHNFDIISVIAPGYDDHRSFSNTILQKIFFALSTIIIGKSYIKHNFQLKKNCFIVLTVSVLFALGTGQRREVFTIILFYLALSNYSNLINRDRREFFKVPLVFKIVGIVTLMIVVWYWRVIATNGKDLAVVLGIRSPIDIFFGSIATGFPSLNLVIEYVNVNSFQPLMLIQGILHFIPRGIWADKPIVLPDLLQQEMGLIANPSSFVYGDMYAIAGSFSIFFVPILFLSLKQFFILPSKLSVDHLLAASYFIPCIFILFKNGFVAASFHFLLFLLILKSSNYLNFKLGNR